MPRKWRNTKTRRGHMDVSEAMFALAVWGDADAAFTLATFGYGNGFALIFDEDTPARIRAASIDEQRGWYTRFYPFAPLPADGLPRVMPAVVRDDIERRIEACRARVQGRRQAEN